MEGIKEAKRVPSKRKKRRTTTKKKQEELTPKPMHLTKLEMIELELHQTHAEKQIAIKASLENKEKLLHIEYSQRRDVIRREQAATVVNLEKAKSAYNAVRAAVEQRLDVSLDGCTVRQDGKVTRVNEQGDPVDYDGDEVGG